MKNDTPARHTRLFGIIIILLLITIILVAYANLELAQLKKSIAGINPPEALSGSGIIASPENDAIMGNPDARVTIVEFSDYECPYCGKFYRETFPEIKKEYIDTGKVNFAYRDFPLTNIHPFAEKAAEASECAHDQGKFWEYADVLFSHQDALTVENLASYARGLDLNMTTFITCLDSGAKAGEVQKDLNEGISYGVKGTPAFFINGQFISGARPYSVFSDAIEKALFTN